MKSGHILIEAVCLCGDEEMEECRSGGNISGHCLQKNHEITPCKYFGFKSARAAAAVTDDNGDVIYENEFFGGSDLSPQEYSVEEKEWIVKCITGIDDVRL